MISRLLTFVTQKLQEHLVRTFTQLRCNEFQKHLSNHILKVYEAPN